MWQKTKSFYTELVNRWLGFYHRKVWQRVQVKPRQTSAAALLKYAGTWAGDDLEDCLADVLQARGASRF